MKRVGIFAGTFDPIHTGHLAFAESALQEGLEKVWFVVEPRPRRKQGVRALEHRQAMVQLAIEKNPRLGQIILEQARFTPHETIPILQARFAGYQLVLLFGGDVLGHIAHWPHIQDLANSVELMIASRHHDDQALKDTLYTLETTRELYFRYTFIQPDKAVVSSSKIRLALKRKKLTSDIPATVATYIDKYQLYSSVD